MLESHTTHVNFYDDAHVQEHHYPEVIALVKAIMGASGVQVFPHMHKNEAIIVKVYDDGETARFVAHTATSPADFKPRERIEVRTMPYDRRLNARPTTVA